MRKYLIASAACLAMLLTALVAAPAQATKNVGPWWSGHYASNGIDVQAHYINSANGTTRADGFTVTVNAGCCGYVTQVDLAEYYGKYGTQRGWREVFYSPTSKTASMTGISTAFLPFITCNGTTYATIEAFTSTGNATVQWIPICQ